MFLKTLLLVAVLLGLVAGDCYLHNPRGSNDRLNEANENRNNDERMCDTQNNAKGGYCVGPAMSYYEGSQLSVEWTSQHGCGDNKHFYCNMVLQYMCSSKNAPALERVRDGTTTDTIPDNAANAATETSPGVFKYGMHESYQYYQDCKARSRNKGLFIADRNLNGNDARYTRQNNGGTRHGFECTEERDYYPYWAPTPWKDIAILSNDPSWCSFYKKESQNVKDRFVCMKDGKQIAPIVDTECATATGTWTKVDSHGIGAPACMKATWQRDNHLGNSNNEGGQAALFNWTLPLSGSESCIAGDDCACVFRIRYNISTGDLLGYDGNRPDAGFIDFNSNKPLSPVTQDQIVSQDGLPHQLALDTSQFGRTFQDRSHTFSIRPRSGIRAGARIFNLNVRGKRGNIVQAYPSTEYDFTPTTLNVRNGDYIHFQWTGCDTNPAGNAGEGTAGTDRSNIVQIKDYTESKPADDIWLSQNKKLFPDSDLRKRFAYLDQTNCKSYEELKKENANNNNAVETDAENCMKLNAAPRYFDGGALKMNTTGTFYYMSSRNNNFSNRGQKGTITVNNLLPNWAIIIVCIGAGFFVASGGIAGMMVYAKSNPHSGIASALSRI